MFLYWPGSTVWLCFLCLYLFVPNSQFTNYSSAGCRLLINVCVTLCTELISELESHPSSLCYLSPVSTSSMSRSHKFVTQVETFSTRPTVSLADATLLNHTMPLALCLLSEKHTPLFTHCFDSIDCS